MRRAWVIGAAVVLLAVAVRLLSWPLVFTPDGVQLIPDGDPYYHALRSLRIAAAWPAVDWFDPSLNFPIGAEIPWPPLMDHLIATLAVATGGANADHVARVAAALPVALGAASAILVALLGRAVGVPGSWMAALVLAVLPASVSYSVLGRADHHVLELVLWTGCCLLYAKALVAERRSRLFAALLGICITLSFWNWTGSGFYLIVLALHPALLVLVAPEPAVRAAATLARACGIAAILLLVSVASFGPPGALGRATLSGITALPAVLTMPVALFSALLVVVARRARDARWPVRLALTAGAAGIAVMPLVAVLGSLSGGAAGIASALAALGRSNAWYRDITEFRPLAFSGQAPLTDELAGLLMRFGLVPFAAIAGIVALARAWRSKPERRSQLLLLGVLTTFLPIAALRARFDLYALVPLALLGAWGAWLGADLVARRISTAPSWLHGATALALLVVLLLPAAPGLQVELGDPSRAELARTLTSLRTTEASVGREAVVANWTLGHHVLWFAGRPVLASPFGTEGGKGAMEDYAAILFATEPETLERNLERRRVGHLLLQLPVTEMGALSTFAPPQTPVAVRNADSMTQGRAYDVHEAFWRLLSVRLYFFDGTAREDEREGLSGFRLVAESSSDTTFAGFPAATYKLFERVRGASLMVSGAPPGAEVVANAAVRTSAGRVFTWATTARADQGGCALVRVPYATGRNGDSWATPFKVLAGGRSGFAAISAETVLRGDTLPVVVR